MKNVKTVANLEELYNTLDALFGEVNFERGETVRFDVSKLAESEKATLMSDEDLRVRTLKNGNVSVTFVVRY